MVQWGRDGTYILSFYNENEQITFKTTYTLVIGKGLGRGRKTQVILRIGSLGYARECAKRLRANYLKPAFNKTAF